MAIFLNQLCDIQLGHTARGRLEPVEGEGVRAIQLRDTAPEGGRATDVIGQYRLDPIPERYWARQGDVLFRSRGDRNTATALADWFKEPAVVVMPLVILRPKTEATDPEYLAWFINQPPAQQYFDSCARGTGMRMIPVGCLAELEVPLPELRVQRSIAEVDGLACREFKLATRLAERRRLLTQFALIERAHKNIPTHTARRASALSRSKKEGLK
jgi:hypothetical protein